MNTPAICDVAAMSFDHAAVLLTDAAADLIAAAAAARDGKQNVMIGAAAPAVAAVEQVQAVLTAIVTLAKVPRA